MDIGKVVVIGGVAGGATAAARLRRLSEDLEIVLLERGEYISYANCGLPYHVGDVISEREELLLQTPERMRERYNIDVRVLNEVVAIHKERREVTVRRLPEGGEYVERYDKLIIATGSSPLRPPIPGIDSPRIQSLWTVPDTDRIRETIEALNIRSAAVIGGGFIGLEMAENLRHRGIRVSVVEAMDQVMAPLDREMAELLHGHLRDKGLALYLGDAVERFTDRGGDVLIRMKSGRELEAELVILAIGVRPNGQLAKEAGLAMNARGGIVASDGMQTSDPHIYAVGDVIQVKDLLFRDDTMVPLAGPANKQGRIAADNIMGAQERYKGTLGSAIVKLFDLSAASTGSNEKALQRRGLKKGVDYQSHIIIQNHHAGYYPGAMPLILKLLFSMDGSRVFGAQVVGYEGVDKRIDVLAAAIRMKASVKDLEELELSYAPPYSSAKDPVNMAGFVAGNIIAGHSRFSSWDVLETGSGVFVLDVRNPEEAEEYALPGARVIPLDELRGRLGELPRDKEIVVFCAVGVRAHNAARILSNHGFEGVSIYPGGADFYQATHR